MRLFYSEILKNLKLWHWFLLLIIFVGYAYYGTYRFATNAYSPVIITRADPFFSNAFFVYFRIYLPSFSLPLIIGLLCYACIIFMEERQNMWLLHGVSNYYQKLHLAKLFSIYAFLVVFIAMYYLVTVIGIKQYFHSLPIKFTQNKPQHFKVEFWLMLKYLLNTLGLLCASYGLIIFWPLKKYRLAIALLGPFLIFSFFPKQISPSNYLFDTDRVIYGIRKVAKSEEYFSSIPMFGQHEIISLVYTAIYVFIICKYGNKLKYLFYK